VSARTTEVENVAKRALELAEELADALGWQASILAEIELLKHRLNDKPTVFCAQAHCPGHQHASETCPTTNWET
jgi:hypothetical protein